MMFFWGNLEGLDKVVKKLMPKKYLASIVVTQNLALLVTMTYSS